uniref:DUF7918 domain-containing protein n=1 Tax=Mycena chlorophos TaxID=658473 RepID=A0ABQ0LVA1_MYCCL|nr:predicted protein [Mycena chlorophos]
MPLSANGIDAWVAVGGPGYDSEARTYQPESLQGRDSSTSGWTAWIASELGQEFSIHWRNTDVFCQTVGRVWVDGIECSGEILRGPNYDTRVAGRRTSGSAVQPFVFSKIDLTDDDTFLHASSSRDIGTIKLEIWTINMTGTKPFSNSAPVADAKVHERSKKGVAHQVKFGAPVEGNQRSAAVIEYLDTSPLATFTFKYRSMDILRANGIAPTRASTSTSRTTKRKSRTMSVKLEDKPPLKRLKREHRDPDLLPRTFKPGETIDLTNLDDDNDAAEDSPIPLGPSKSRGRRRRDRDRGQNQTGSGSSVAAEESMDVLLQTNRSKLEALNAQYTESLEAVLDLQATLIDDILPSVADELELDDDAVEWARDWLADTPTVFRILRRNKFTRSFALESARKTLVWRFHHLWPPSPPSESTTPLIQCLPPPTTDPFDRPVLVIRVVSFNDSSDAYKPVLLQAFERLRLYLVHLNADGGDEDEHEGVVGYFDVGRLPSDYGGTLPCLAELQDPLREPWALRVSASSAASIARLAPEPPSPSQQQKEQKAQPAPCPPPALHRAASSILLHPRSLLNPFFGYPVAVPLPIPSSASASASLSSGERPQLRHPHGRRRKRDLARTLLALAWERWRGYILGVGWAGVGVWVLVVLLVLVRRRRRLLRTGMGRT